MRNTKLPAAYWVVFVRELVTADKGYTTAELAHRFQISPYLTRRWLNTMREAGLVYVSSWARLGKHRNVYTQRWRWGLNKTDVKRPARMTEREYKERHNAKQRAARAAAAKAIQQIAQTVTA